MLVDSLVNELHLQSNYLHGASIETIYFGGGTPSQLSIVQLERLLQTINRLHQVTTDCEITFEANPDDISKQYLIDLRNVGINRLSIGIQSFCNEDLKLMNRRHTSDQAIEAVNDAFSTGFHNLTGDLIYGLPWWRSNSKWENNLDSFFKLPFSHLSAYHLSVEPNTVFGDRFKTGQYVQPDEDTSLQQFNLLIDKAEANGFIHYEISNFAKPDCFAKHNSNYWNQTKYLGLGPSAHSYNGVTRQWNIADYKEYIASIEAKTIPCTTEILSATDKTNDYLITHLRTIQGIDLLEMEKEFGYQTVETILKTSKKYIASGLLIADQNHLILSRKAKFISDSIISDLMFVE